ncbi:MAG: DUF4139 domain-containing protein, partial [Lentisphaerae bacterium]|nr:DUF4139 domain-containing protein [Lentisphaerota bacterium]
GAVSLTLTYLLPGAAWEPKHELRFQGSRPDEVHLVSYASVTQTTGEDWQDVRLSFATQSPGALIRIPELDALLLGVPGRPVARPGAGVSSFSKAKVVFEQQNLNWNGIFNPGIAPDVYARNRRTLEGVESRALETFERLSRRGTTAHFAGTGRQIVRSDGVAVRVPLGSLTLPVTEQIVAVPSSSLNAVQTAQLVNAGNGPLLPGSVALYRDNAFLGLTELDFVAEAEPFALLTGVADRIKLERVLDRRRSELVRGGSRTRMKIAFDVSARNLGAEPTRIKLMDRVPVSEDKEIRVSGIDVEPEGKPDAKGLLTWEPTLDPGQKVTYRISYILEYPTGINLSRARRRDAALNAPAAALQLDVDSQAQPAEHLYQQIGELEAQF